MPYVPYIYFAFAHDSRDPLPNLEREGRQLYQLLLPGEKELHFNLHRDEFASVELIAKNLGTFKDQVVIFHYGGHSRSQALFLGNIEANAAGIADLLCQQQNLKLVFLNGCSTQAQVDYLLQRGIPAVIATSRPIEDELATIFAENFYDSLAEGFTLKDAFDRAKAVLNGNNQPVRLSRGIISDEEEVSDETWILRVSDETQFDFRLPNRPFIETGKQQGLLDWSEFFSKNSFKPNKTGRITTVNCNRKTTYGHGIQSDFLKYYQKSKNIVFFMSACPFQKPVSLAKRLIYEIAESFSVAYTSEEQNIDSEDVLAEIPPIYFEVGFDTWGKTWKKIQSQFSSLASDPASLAESSQCAGKNFVALIFQVTERQWENADLENHIAAILDRFVGLPLASNKYLLFFSFEFSDAHGAGKAQCEDKIAKIDALQEKYRENLAIFHYKQFFPVEEADIKLWYQDMAKSSKPDTLKELISTLRSHLSDTYRQRSNIDMVYVEEMQQAAYEYIIRPQPNHF